MVFDGSGPLVERCDGFDGSLWSNCDITSSTTDQIYLTYLPDILPWPTWPTLPPDLPTTLTYRLIYPTYLPDLPTHLDNLQEPKDNLPEPTDNLPESTDNLPVLCFTIQPVIFQPNLTTLNKFQNFTMPIQVHNMMIFSQSVRHDSQFWHILFQSVQCRTQFFTNVVFVDYLVLLLLLLLLF